MAKDITISKSTRINRSKQEVYDYLKHTRNQEKFSVWNMADPSKQTSEEGTDGSVGYVYRWDSKMKNVGAGSQQIINLRDGEEIAYEVQFERPMKNTASSKFNLTEHEDGTTEVSWSFKGPTKFPMSLFRKSFEKMLGKDIEKSLKQLKTNLEA